MTNGKKVYSIPTYRLQMVREGSIKAHSITNAQDIIKAIKSFTHSDREFLIGLYLNSRNQVIAHHVVSIGTVNTAIVHPREVFKLAIMKNACSVIIAHNHPSGGLDPSDADLKITKRLIAAGKILGIELLDHIIITPVGKTFSIKKRMTNVK
jgi:DNA repair protein RadC